MFYGLQVAVEVKNPPASADVRDGGVVISGLEDSLEEVLTTHSMFSTDRGAWQATVFRLQKSQTEATQHVETIVRKE